MISTIGTGIINAQFLALAFLVVVYEVTDLWERIRSTGGPSPELLVMWQLLFRCKS